MILLHIGDGRILQMFLASEGRLLAVRMVRVEGGKQGLEHLAVVLGKGHVLLLVDGLEFRMESADYVVAEPVCLYARPIVNLVGRDILLIYGLVVGCPRVGAFGSDKGHQFVVFVRDGDFGGLIADGIYFVIDGLTLSLIFSAPVLLEERFNLVEHRLFCCIVGSSELLGALEHEVLEVVGKTRGL